MERRRNGRNGGCNLGAISISVLALVIQNQPVPKSISFEDQAAVAQLQVKQLRAYSNLLIDQQRLNAATNDLEAKKQELRGKYNCSGCDLTDDMKWITK